MIESQSSFSRTLANAGKLGAYYTDQGHCRSISSFLSFGDSTLVLEPSIGDGSAVKTVTGKQEGDRKYIFGIEINQDTFVSIKGDPAYEAVINADFLHGTKCSNNVFPFCFANPPYGEVAEGDHRRRLEALFLERIFTLMKAGGILVYVIPEYIFRDIGFVKSLIGRYEPLHMYRFRKPEYQKFKQCVFIGRRRKSFGWMPEWIEGWINETMEHLEELPEVWEGEKVTVPAAAPDTVKVFTTAAFHPDAYVEFLRKEKNTQISKITRMVCTTEPFGTEDIHPPIGLKRNHLYLLAVSGEGQGLVGDEEQGTRHLQRGSAKRIEKSTIVEQGDREVEIVTTSTQITMKVVEADGTITTLQ